MFGNGIIVGDGFDHLDVELFLSVGKSWFEYNEEIVVVIGFEIYSFGEGGHLAACQVYTALDFARTVAELEHVGVVFSSVVL